MLAGLCIVFGVTLLVWCQFAGGAAELDADVSFDRIGYQVGHGAVASVRVDSGSAAVEASRICLEFEHADGATEFARPLAEDVTVEPDRPWQGEVELAPFELAAPLGYYDVRLAVETAEGRLTREIPGIILFRQRASIELLETDTTLYSPGQPVKARVLVRNTDSRLLRDKEVRCGMGTPWISPHRDEEHQASDGRGTFSGIPFEQGVTQIPELRPGDAFDTGWVELFRFPEEEPDFPVLRHFTVTVCTTGRGWDDVVAVQRSRGIYCQPWGYQGPWVYDPGLHLFPHLQDVDHTRVPYRELEQYDAVRHFGQGVPESWMGFVPHQDDEMAFAFLIPESVRKGHNFHVVLTAAGDAELGARARQFGNRDCPTVSLAIGYMRRQETLHAMRHLGASEEHVTFLGLPDGGLGQVYHNHPESSDPFLTFSTCVDRVPYAFAYRRNLPHSREAVVEACKELLLKHQPEHVFCCHPDERHVDHRTTTLFVLEALRQIRAEGGQVPTVHVYVGYRAGDFEKADFEYEPEEWGISERDAALAHQARWFYQSQGAISRHRGAPDSLEIYAERMLRRWFVLKGF
ncbi:MAG: PIG-L deacetylase family protein [Planctomycetota bacterium]